VDSVTGQKLRTDEALPSNFSTNIQDIAISTFNQVLFISNKLGHVMAYHILPNATGRLLWYNKCLCIDTCASLPIFLGKPYQAFFSPIIFVDREQPSSGIIISGIGNQICTFDMTSGELLWNFSLETYIFGQPVVSPEGNIFTSTISPTQGNFMVAI